MAMAMAVSVASLKQTPFPITSSTPHQPFPAVKTSFLPPTLPSSTATSSINLVTTRRRKPPFFSPISSATKIPRCRPLDRHAAKHSRLRFARKLKTLLLSKPRHFLPLRVLSRCRRYLGLPPSRSLLSMILRYPALFRLFDAPSHSSPTSNSLLSVTLTPAATALAAEESLLRARIATSLASKLQCLLMLCPHRRLLLSKLVHLAPDLGLHPDFRSRLCNRHPDRFRTVDTSYGRALELVSWEPSLATPLPPIQTTLSDRIIDRPPKFKQLHLRRGLNVKRRHRNYLIHFQELPEVCPYAAAAAAAAAAEEEGRWRRRTAEEEEKRACAAVREVLGMTVEKRTLVDHLTHFRKDFGLPNRLRALLVRHPELFYVSVKGVRDSAFLVEAYDHKGKLLVEDELLAEKERLWALVREGKRMRRERRRDVSYGDDNDDDDDDEEDEEEEEDDDGFEDLFESGIGDDWEEFGDGVGEDVGHTDFEGFWVKKAAVSTAAEKLGSGGEAVEAW